MENKKLFELDFGIDALIKSTSDVKNSINELKETQKKLKAQGDTSSATFVKNEADLKSLNNAYRSSIKAITDNTKSIVDAVNKEKLMSLALQEEVKSIQQARDQNKVLNKLRNETNVFTEEGRNQLALLNEKLDQNNKFIKENVDAYAQQKINIGNYKDGIVEAANELNPFNGSFSDFIIRSKEAGGVSNLVKSGLGGMANGFLGLTKASLAFIATPVGAVLAVLVGAFALIRNAMNRSEDATNKLKRSFAAVTGVFNTVLKALEPVGEFLIDGIVMGFELAAKAADEAIKLISRGLEAIGFDGAADSVNSWREEIQEGVKSAQDLADAEALLAQEQRKAQVIQLDYQKQAEKLRQIRDDENLSTKERIAANEELGQVLKEQLASELSIAQLALKAANLRIEADGRTRETLDGQAEALTLIADIQERITGQESEQLTNRVSLQNEARDKAIQAAKEATAAAISESKTRLEIFKAENKDIEGTLGERILVQEKIRDERLAILAEELKAGNVTRSEAELEALNIKNEFLEKQKDLSIQNAEEELETYLSGHRARIEAGQLLNDALIQQETDRLEGIAEKEAEFQASRLEQGEINQREYNDLLFGIDEEYRIAKEALNLELAEQKRAAEAIDIESQRAINAERFDFDLGLQLADLERQRELELQEAERTGADKNAIITKYAEQEKQVSQIVNENKTQLAADTFGQLATIFGKESAAGKAAAIAQTTITTYQSATNAFNSLSGIPIVGPVLGGIAAAAAVAAGIANVRKITSTKTPTIKGERGLAIDIGGNRHSSGGTQFWGEDGTHFEAEKGEKMFVLSRAASASLSPLLSDINQLYGGVSLSRHSAYLESGGQVLRGASSNTQRVSGSQVNSAEIARVIVEANRTQKAPVVMVQDINDGVGNYVEVVEGSNI